MKLTDDVVKALNGCIEEGYESVAEFARLTNVSANTITKYLRKETECITDETWRKIHPLIRPYLPKKRRKGGDDSHHRPLELDTDQKILLDAFGELPRDLQKQKLIEVVNLAKQQIKLRQERDERDSKN